MEVGGPLRRTSRFLLAPLTCNDRGFDPAFELPVGREVFIGRNHSKVLEPNRHISRTQASFKVMEERSTGRLLILVTNVRATRGARLREAAASFSLFARARPALGSHTLPRAPPLTPPPLAPPHPPTPPTPPRSAQLGKNSMRVISAARKKHARLAKNFYCRLVPGDIVEFLHDHHGRYAFQVVEAGVNGDSPMLARASLAPSVSSFMVAEGAHRPGEPAPPAPPAAPGPPLPAERPLAAAGSSEAHWVELLLVSAPFARAVLRAAAGYAAREGGARAAAAGGGGSEALAVALAAGVLTQWRDALAAGAAEGGDWDALFAAEMGDVWGPAGVVPARVLGCFAAGCAHPAPRPRPGAPLPPPIGGPLLPLLRAGGVARAVLRALDVALPHVEAALGYAWGSHERRGSGRAAMTVAQFAAVVTRAAEDAACRLWTPRGASPLSAELMEALLDAAPPAVAPLEGPLDPVARRAWRLNRQSLPSALVQ
jgi:hypothetical protein